MDWNHLAIILFPFKQILLIIFPSIVLIAAAFTSSLIFGPCEQNENQKSDLEIGATAIAGGGCGGDSCA